MVTGLLIFLIYTAVFIFILYRLSLKKSFALSFKESTFVFIVKIAAGCFYGYFFLHLSQSDHDTWLYHQQGLEQYALLKKDPLHFFINDIIPKGYKSNQLLTIFNSNDSFAKDLELTLLLKLLALFDLLSGGRYYVNVIFYDALVFWGSYFLFKIFNKKFPEKRTLWLLFIFYFPPLLFWSSGIRKDGLCFAVLCGLIYQLYCLFEVKISFKRIIYFCILFLVLFLIRNYIALSFVPILIAYALSKKIKKFSLAIFCAVALSCGMIFFLTTFCSNGFNLPLKMAERQHAFLQLSGNSYLSIDTLQQNIASYTKILPTALNHVFLRPYISEAQGILYILSFLEVIFFFFLLVRVIFKPCADFKKLMNDPLLLSVTFLAVFNHIIIGYTVPFLGAILRYKASFEILFILVFLQLQKTNSIKNIFLFRTKAFIE